MNESGNIFKISFTGALADITGDYDITFYVAGVTLTLAGLICFPLRRISKWENNKKKDTYDITIESDEIKVPDQSNLKH